MPTAHPERRSTTGGVWEAAPAGVATASAKTGVDQTAVWTTRRRDTDFESAGEFVIVFTFVQQESSLTNVAKATDCSVTRVFMRTHGNAEGCVFVCGDLVTVRGEEGI